MKRFYNLFFFYIFLSLPLTVLAQSSSVTFQNPLKENTICGLMKDVLNVALYLGTPVMIGFLVYAGFKFVTALGKPDALQAAKSNLLNTIIGIALFLGAWTLVTILAGTIGALQPGLSISSC